MQNALEVEDCSWIFLVPSLICLGIVCHMDLSAFSWNSVIVIVYDILNINTVSHKDEIKVTNHSQQCLTS